VVTSSENPAYIREALTKIKTRVTLRGESPAETPFQERDRR